MKTIRNGFLFFLFITGLIFLVSRFVSISIDINMLSYILAGLFTFSLTFSYWITPNELVTVSLKFDLLAPFFRENGRYTLKLDISALSFKKGERKEIYNQSVTIKLRKSDSSNLLRDYLILADEHIQIHTDNIRRLAPSAKIKFNYTNKKTIEQIV